MNVGAAHSGGIWSARVTMFLFAPMRV